MGCDGVENVLKLTQFGWSTGHSLCAAEADVVSCPFEVLKVEGTWALGGYLSSVRLRTSTRLLLTPSIAIVIEPSYLSSDVSRSSDGFRLVDLPFARGFAKSEVA